MGNTRSTGIPGCHRDSLPRSWSRRLLCALAAMCGLLVPLAATADDAPQPVIRYKPNQLPTTVFGPPAADILVHPSSNFLECAGGPIALCYYSGPPPSDPGDADLSCTLTDDPEFSNCRCIEMDYGPYFVDINAILDEKIYLETVKVCGHGGANCKGVPNMAPVCAAINDNTFLPHARPKPTIISTFSHRLNSAVGYKIGNTNCLGDDAALYSGCMTAPCVRTPETTQICQTFLRGGEEVTQCNDVPIDICTCPNFDGPFQVGQNAAECALDEGYTWSAAYTPIEALISKVKTGISALPCVPDLPGEGGCPLLPPDPGKDTLQPTIPDIPAAVNCNKVCKEYRNSDIGGVEVGFTCDATLCTAPLGSRTTPGDVPVVDQACQGLGSGRKGSLSEITRLETAVGCSCCASQICGCEPSPQTDEKIGELNWEQRQLGIEPQCDYNGSLCGKP